MTISGGRTEQLDIIAGFLLVTGFTSDFLSFIVVEHIRFFHGALQFWLEWSISESSASETLAERMRSF